MILFFNKKRVSARMAQAKEKFKNHEFLYLIAQREIDNFIETIRNADSWVKQSIPTSTHSLSFYWSLSVYDSYIYTEVRISSPVYKEFYKRYDNFCSKFNLEELKYYWDAQALAEFMGDIVNDGVQERLKQCSLHKKYTINYHRPNKETRIEADSRISDIGGGCGITYTFNNPYYIAPNKW